jgi:hypothetical protein
MPAVVDYVLSGQRLKMRLTGHNSVILMNLQGLRTLSNDANVDIQKEFSNNALVFTK